MIINIALIVWALMNVLMLYDFVHYKVNYDDMLITLGLDITIFIIFGLLI